MKSISVKQSIEYWKKTAERDHDTVRGLMRLKRYPEALFYGHIVLEKILKAHVVQKTKVQAPYTHDLIRLQEIAALDLPENTLLLLDEVSDFNIRARYPEYKLTFYKRCTKSFADRYIEAIIQLYKELCQRLKQKK